MRQGLAGDNHAVGIHTADQIHGVLSAVAVAGDHENITGSIDSAINLGDRFRKAIRLNKFKAVRIRQDLNAGLFIQTPGGFLDDRRGQVVCECQRS